MTISKGIFAALILMGSMQTVQAYDYFEYSGVENGTDRTAVFGASERKYLESKGLIKIARAVKVRSSRPLSLKFGVRDKAGTFQAFSNPEEYQWALQNSGGGALQLPLYGSATYPVQKVKGEDAGIDRAYAVLQSRGLSVVKKVRVAVLDSGLDTTHPEFRGRIARNVPECEWQRKYKSCRDAGGKEEACRLEAGPADPDANGYPGDCQGMNFAVSNGTPTDPLVGGAVEDSDSGSHGTFVAGIIAARKDGVGTTGVFADPEGAVEILPIKVSGRMGAGVLQGTGEEDSRFVGKYSEVDHIARGVLYATRMKADLIHMSLGWGLGEDSLLMREMVKLAIDSGIGVVVASGNTASFTGSYPCAYSGVVCVGAHRADGSVAPFSSFGTSVDLLAPGEWILSTTRKDRVSGNYTESRGYTFRSGTSFSAPYVTGALGVLLSRGYSLADSRARLCDGARRGEGGILQANDSRRGPTSRCGKLDLERALTLESPLKKPRIEWAEKPPYYLRHVPGKNSTEWKTNWINSGANATGKITLVVADQSFQFDTWKAGEIKTVSVPVAQPDLRESSLSRISFHAVDQAGSELGRAEFLRDWIRTLDDEEIKKAADLKIPVAASFSDDVSKSRKVRIESVPRNGLPPSWAILYSQQGEIKVKRVSAGGGESEWVPVPVTGGGLQGLAETEKYFSIVLLTIGPIEGVDRGTLHWVCYEKAAAGKPDVLKKHSKTVLMDFNDLGELFSPVFWVASPESPCGVYPVWSQQGRITESDLPKPGPWDRTPSNLNMVRLYSFDPNGEKIRTGIFSDREEWLGTFASGSDAASLKLYTRGKNKGHPAVLEYQVTLGIDAKFDLKTVAVHTEGPLLDLTPVTTTAMKEEAPVGVESFYRQSTISGSLEWTLRDSDSGKWERHTFAPSREARPSETSQYANSVRGYGEWGAIFSFNGARDFPEATLFSNDNLHVWRGDGAHFESSINTGSGISLFEIARFPFPYRWVWSSAVKSETAIFLSSFDGLFLGTRVWKKVASANNYISPIYSRMLPVAECSEWDIERHDDIRSSYIWFQCADGLYRTPLLLN